MVQRAYNAFAVRVLSDEGERPAVVPATETMEGVLCIEMRIRLYPDGLMSSLLSQLIKVLTVIRCKDFFVLYFLTCAHA